MGKTDGEDRHCQHGFIGDLGYGWLVGDLVQVMQKAAMTCLACLPRFVILRSTS